MVAKSCPTLCDPMYCSLPDSSVRGIFPARILEWVATYFSRGSSQPRNWSQVSCTAGGYFTAEPSGKPQAVDGHNIKRCKLRHQKHEMEGSKWIEFLYKIEVRLSSG